MGNAQNAVDLLFPANRQQVLAALLLQPDRSLHLRELARLTGSNAGTLAREVDKLTQAGLLLRSDQGNQARYSANVQHPLHAELAAIFRKTHGVLPALRAALAPLGWTLDRHTLDQTWKYCAAVTRMMTCSPLEVLDWALAQRAMPAMLAAMDLPALRELPSLLTGLPRCLKLMDQPLPLPPL